MQNVSDRFLDVTEAGGQLVSSEQLDRACHRYHWAANHSVDKDVLEVACGSGPGLGLLKAVSRSLVAGDISPALVSLAAATYGGTVDLRIIDALDLPFPDNSFDCVILFEAIYYLPDHAAFVAEVRRVLRPGGTLLLTSANKDLFDFTPSPHASSYLGAAELSELLERSGFAVDLAGYHSTRSVSLFQRLLRPAKMLAGKLGLVPKTMKGKEVLKRLVFGALVPMPRRLDQVSFRYDPPMPIPSNTPDAEHKIIYCAATIS